MRNTLRHTLTTLAFLAAAAYSAAPAAGDEVVADPFAGEWSVTATPDHDAAGDGQGEFQEAVLFHDGQFSAAVFAMFGFTPAEYTVSLVNERPAFQATLVSSDRGALVWSGAETPTGMGGTLVWTRVDGTAIHFALVGQRQ